MSVGSSFFDTIHQYPTLADVKLIAEPWGVGGEVSGPAIPCSLRAEYGKYRDTMRRFWKSDPANFPPSLTDSSARVTCISSTVASHTQHQFLTAHDGFTLCDLVSYDEKHNEANKDDNKDGAIDNDSWNMGVEGPQTTRG
jgi:isoamylase